MQSDPREELGRGGTGAERIIGTVLSATLDTSCALNFLGLRDEEPDNDLLQLLHLGMRHRVLLGVTGEAYAEVAEGPDPGQALRQAARLEVLGRLEVPAERSGEVDQLAEELHGALFPNAQPGSRTDEHNRRDCRQLASHKVVGRRLFVTRDQGTLRRVNELAARGIEVASTSEALARAQQQEPVGATPGSVAVRAIDQDGDEAAIRAILAPLSEDYPDFERWLTTTLAQPKTRIQVAEMDGRVGAVAITRRKDARVWKLAAFMIAPEFRQAGLGGHLLWSELRVWCESGLAKVYVTVSSKREELVDFFSDFGFVIEGASARRYADEHAELVLAKHLVHGRVVEADLDAFVENTVRAVLAPRLPQGPWAPPLAPVDAFRWHGTGAHRRLEQLVEDGEVLRTWSLLDLERIFHPVTLAIDDRPALLVPIEKQWAEALIEFLGEQLQLGGEENQRLLLRPDNAYYCYPTAYEMAVAGTPILLYVKAPTMALVGEARIVESEIAAPEDLYVRFGGLGIYAPDDIRGHLRSGGPYDGCAMALRFAQYQPFARPLTHQEMIDVLGRPLSGPQGLTPISFQDFETLRRTGSA